MRSDVRNYTMTSPATLSDALALLASEPQHWTLFAGGTELMVALGAGRLEPRNYLSLWQLKELRGISSTKDFLRIGAGVTFAELRRTPLIADEFPLLAQAASWIGSLGNQSRATLGGNIVNASPAADSPPALLVYDAEIELISSIGSRRLPYSDFHLGYKKTVLKQDEVVLALHLPRRFQMSYQRLQKVGARKAQAISKVALAMTATIEGVTLRKVRIGAASLRNTPMRASAAEAILEGNPLTNEILAEAVKALRAEAKPIDDIRSTAEYRSRVAGNLLTTFLGELLLRVSK